MIKDYKGYKGKNLNVSIVVKKGDLPVNADKKTLNLMGLLMQNPDVYYEKVYVGECIGKGGEFEDPKTGKITKGGCYAPTLDDYLAGKGYHAEDPEVHSVPDFIMRERKYLDDRLAYINERMRDNAYHVTIVYLSPKFSTHFTESEWRKLSAVERADVIFMRSESFTLAKNFPIARLNNWPRVFPEAKSRLDGRKSAGTLKAAKSLSSSLQQ